MMLLIRADGRAEDASPWFRRLRPGESVMLAADGQRGPVRTFRRLICNGHHVLVESGATQAIVTRVLAAVA